MAIRLYETKMEFDYDSSDGSVKTTHIVYIESDGLYFDGTIYGTETSSGAADGITIDNTVATDSTGLSVGDFEFNHERIAFGKHQLFAKADGSGVVFTGTLGATLDSADNTSPHKLGTMAGFVTGGLSPSPTQTIDKFPFSISSGTATDVGDLRSPSPNPGSTGPAGHSSSTDGFTSGGSSTSTVDTINKFPFNIIAGIGTSVGSLAVARSFTAGIYSTTDGFTAGGQGPQPPSTVAVTQIDKFPFSISGGTATDVGDTNAPRHELNGHSDETAGFTSGGQQIPSSSGLVYNIIERFPYSISSASASDVGDLSRDKHAGAGMQSSTDGLHAGGKDRGDSPNFAVTRIDKFPFSISGGTATNVGDLTQQGAYTTGHSHTSDGFVTGGYIPGTPGPDLTNIQKFPFNITSGYATNVGSLTREAFYASGQQV